MQDSIIIERIWQDLDFFEVKITCVSDLIIATTKVYTSNKNIDNLSNKIKDFIYGNVNECLWENGEKGDDATAFISLKFIYKDKMGHIKIEVYMEIDDGGKFSSHNCCFYVNTEIGLLTNFRNQIYNIKESTIGNKIILNQI